MDVGFAGIGRFGCRARPVVRRVPGVTGSRRVRNIPPPPGKGKRRRAVSDRDGVSGSGSGSGDLRAGAEGVSDESSGGAGFGSDSSAGVSPSIAGSGSGSDSDSVSGSDSGFGARVEGSGSGFEEDADGFPERTTPMNADCCGSEVGTGSVAGSSLGAEGLAGAGACVGGGAVGRPDLFEELLTHYHDMLLGDDEARGRFILNLMGRLEPTIRHWSKLLSRDYEWLELYDSLARSILGALDRRSEPFQPDDATHLWNYFLRVARNKLINRYRELKRRAPIDANRSVEDLGRLLIQKHTETLRDLVGAALEVLPDDEHRYREIFLDWVEGRTIPQTSETLRLSHATVERRRRNIRVILQSRFRKRGVED